MRLQQVDVMGHTFTTPAVPQGFEVTDVVIVYKIAGMNAAGIATGVGVGWSACTDRGTAAHLTRAAHERINKEQNQ